MQTSNPDLLFQTAHDQALVKDRSRKRAAAAHVGSPIEVGKVIDFVIDGPSAFVAESGWQARQVDLESGRTLRVFKGHKGPVTTVAVIYAGGVRYLFTGSWDKTIRVWTVENGECVHTLAGHTDFVKSLTVISGVLISSSSDRTIKVWKLDNLPLGIHLQQSIKRHTRPVDCVVASQSLPGVPDKVYSADSMGVICEWTLSECRLDFVRDLPGHDTSVTQILPVEEGLWSVSMDKTTIYHAKNAKPRKIQQETYVRAVNLVPHQTRSLLVTSGDDEDIKVWETTDDWETNKLVSTLRAHCGSVTAIKFWQSQQGFRVVTGDLDGTLRKWTLQELLEPPELTIKDEGGGMTEDEERELAELMGDD